MIPRCCLFKMFFPRENLQETPRELASKLDDLRWEDGLPINMLCHGKDM